MKKIITFTALLVNFLFISLLAQPADWAYYNNSCQSNCLATEPGYTWVGTNGGLCRINQDTGERNIYNTFNSPLPNSYITCIVIDSSGMKWIGTKTGLASFDGINWAVYNTSNSGLPDNTVNCLTIDGIGNKWIGTNYGLACFDGSLWTVYHYPNTDMFYQISSVAADRLGNVWFGAYDWYYWEGIGLSFEGVPGRYHDGQITYYNDWEMFPQMLVVDLENKLWMWGQGLTGMNTEIASFDGTIWTHYNSSNSELSINYITCLAIDPLNHVWVGGGDLSNYTGSIAEFSGQDWTVYSTTNSGLPDEYVRCLASDEQNRMWIGYAPDYFTRAGGIASYDGTAWQSYSTAFSGLPSDDITCLAIDSTGRKWIGVQGYLPYDGGLASFDGSAWQTYTMSNSGLPNNNVNCLAADSQGNIWIGLITDGFENAGALAKYNGTGWQVIRASETGMPASEVDCIAIDNLNTKWVATSTQYGYEHNLSSYNGYWSDYILNSSPVAYGVNCISGTSAGNLWIGTTGGGIYHMVSGYFQHFTPDNFSNANYGVTSMARDSGGIYWFGTAGGLVSYNGTDWMVYNTDNSGIAANYITCLAIDNLNVKWMGTENNGLIRFDGVHWNNYTTTNSGLITNSITCLVIDQQNVKWIGTDKGLFSFSGSGVPNDDATQEPELLSLVYAYPNPFPGQGLLSFQASLKLYEHGNLEIYNLKGQKVKSFSIDYKNHDITWDGKDNRGSKCASGIYLYRLTTNLHRETHKLIIIK